LEDIQKKIHDDKMKRFLNYTSNFMKPPAVIKPLKKSASKTVFSAKKKPKPEDKLAGDKAFKDFKITYSNQTPKGVKSIIKGLEQKKKSNKQTPASSAPGSGSHRVQGEYMTVHMNGQINVFPD